MSTSTDLDEIYLIYDNPLEKKLSEVRSELARSKFQKPSGDTKLDQGTLGLQGFNYLKVVNSHYNVAVHPLGTQDYYPATEPDYSTCKLIIMTDHFGRQMYDDSQIPSSTPLVSPPGQEVLLFGEPKLVDGFDRGYGDSTNTQKRQALYFNRSYPLQFKDYIKVTDQALTDANKSMRVLDASSGFSFFIRVKLDSLSNNGANSQGVTFLHKIDNDSLDDAVLVSLESNKVRFSVSKTNVDKTRRANTALSINTDYEIWCVYDPAGGTDDLKLKIYVNGTLQTNEASGVFGALGDNTDHDMYIGKRGSLDGGYIQGYIIYCKFFLNYKVSAAEVSQHFTNKLTIGNIAYGKVATTEYPVARNT